jgi:hypothetical protein
MREDYTAQASSQGHAIEPARAERPEPAEFREVPARKKTAIREAVGVADIAVDNWPSMWTTRASRLDVAAFAGVSRAFTPRRTRRRTPDEANG